MSADDRGTDNTNRGLTVYGRGFVVMYHDVKKAKIFEETKILCSYPLIGWQAYIGDQIHRKTCST